MFPTHSCIFGRLPQINFHLPQIEFFFFLALSLSPYPLQTQDTCWTHFPHFLYLLLLPPHFIQQFNSFLHVSLRFSKLSLNVLWWHKCCLVEITVRSTAKMCAGSAALSKLWILMYSKLLLQKKKNQNPKNWVSWWCRLLIMLAK